MLSSIQCACAILSPVRLYNIFSTLSDKQQDILRRSVEYKMRVLNFSATFEIYLSARIIQGDIIINVHKSARKLPSTVIVFQRNLNYLDRFSKYPKISNFMKIRQVGAELFHADGRTGITKLIVAYRNFIKSPKRSFKQEQATDTRITKTLF